MPTKANILLVDDRSDGLLALEVVLRCPEYHLVKARSGEQALLELMEREFAVVLLDVQMPNMDGFETASLIKAQEKFRHIPIIFVTGIHGDPRFVTQGYETGAIDYVLKPFEPNILRSKVAVLVDLHRKTKALAAYQQRQHEKELADTRRRLESGFLIRERRLIALVDNSSDFIAVTARNHQVVYLNGAGMSLVGLHGEAEAYGRSILEFFSEGERDRMSNEVIPRLLKEGSAEDEVWLRNFETGALVPVWFRGFVITDPNTGEVDAIATISRDITEKKAAERALRESEERFRTLTDLAPVGIFFSDQNGRCELTNRLWERLSGLTQEDMREGWFTSVHPEDDRRVRDSWHSAVQEGREFLSEHRLRSPDGAVRWVQSRAVPLRNETRQILGYLGSGIDITNRVETERALRLTAEKLTKSNAELRQFAWIASHDLKEPLRTISSYIRLFERKCRGKFDAEADECIRYVVDSAGQMYRLLNDLMTLAGVSNETNEMQEVDCNDVFDRVLSNIHLSIEENRAQVTRGNLPRLLANTTQVSQLFQNLISNAIKFHRSDIPRARLDAVRNGEEWEFVMVDNGIGIEAEYIEKIFGVFQRLHSREKYPGTGIGLAICSKIMECHGGRIWVESELGRGSQFHFKFPEKCTLTDASRDPAEDSPPSKAAAAGVRP